MHSFLITSSSYHTSSCHVIHSGHISTRTVIIGLIGLFSPCVSFF